MNPDLLLPLVASAAWLVLAGAGLAAYRLRLGQMITMALVWVVIFLGLFVLFAWFLSVRSTASALVYILHNIYYPS